MSVLTRAKKVRSDGESWQLIRLNPSHEEILQALGLIPRPEEPPKKRPGRPKGSKNKSVIKEQKMIPMEVRRKRGRPKGSKNKPKPADAAAGQSWCSAGRHSPTTTDCTPYSLTGWESTS